MDKHKENYMKVILGLISMALLIYIGTTVLKEQGSTLQRKVSIRCLVERSPF